MVNRDKIMIDAILFLFIAIGFPLIYNGIRNASTAGWTFTGHEQAAAVLPLIPWLFLIASVSALAYSVIRGGH